LSDFTDSCRTQARAAWSTAGSFPDRYSRWKKEPGLSGRAQRGCLGVLIFGLVYVFVPLVIFLFVETVIIAWALLLSLLWGVGAAVDGVRRSKPQGSTGPAPGSDADERQNATEQAGRPDPDDQHRRGD
jgi:hypothetical protein